MVRLAGSIRRHCEERSDEAIHICRTEAVDCFASLAMTATNAFFPDSADPGSPFHLLSHLVVIYSKPKAKSPK
jgi:hypothetical protein